MGIHNRTYLTMVRTSAILNECLFLRKFLLFIVDGGVGAKVMLCETCRYPKQTHVISISIVWGDFHGRSEK